MADQESEDDLSASRTSLERQAPHRGNTMVHVCWHRNTSVSMVDFSVAVEVRATGTVISPGRELAVGQRVSCAYRRVDTGHCAGGRELQVAGSCDLEQDPGAGVGGRAGARGSWAWLGSCRLWFTEELLGLCHTIVLDSAARSGLCWTLLPQVGPPG